MSMHISVLKNNYGKEVKRVTFDECNFVKTGNIHVNFSGDPDKGGRFRSTQRVANIGVSYDEAMDLINNGIDAVILQSTNEEYEDREPLCFVPVKLNFDFYKQPVLYLESEEGLTKLNEDTVGTVDDIAIAKVDCLCTAVNSEMKKNGRASLWIDTMYVTIDEGDDPFRSKHFRDGAGYGNDNDLPWRD